MYCVLCVRVEKREDEDTAYHHCVMWRCVRKEERKRWGGISWTTARLVSGWEGRGRVTGEKGLVERGGRDGEGRRREV